jgi:hypothetical protein
MTTATGWVSTHLQLVNIIIIISSWDPICYSTSSDSGLGNCVRPDDPSRWCLHFVVVRGLAWSKDPESCAGGSFATGRVSHAGLVEGDDTDQERHTQPQGVKCGLPLSVPMG